MAHPAIVRVKRQVCTGLRSIGLSSKILGPPGWTTASLESFADEKLTLFPEQRWTSVIAPPTNSGPQFKEFSTLTYPEVLLLRYDRARLYSVFGDLLPVTRTDVVVNYDRFEETTADVYLATRLKLPPVERRAGCYLLLSGAFSHNLFHWYAEIMPIVLAVDYLRGRGIEPTIVVHATHAFQMASLDWIRKACRVEVHQFKNPMELDGLWVVQGLNPVRGAPRPEPIVELWQRLIKNFNFTGRKSERLIFISRSKAPRRRLVNEDDWFAKLEKLGFEKYFFESISPLEQLKICFEAKVIAGTHGAGFTNMVTASNRTLVVECMGPVFRHACYYHLAGVLNQNYAVFPANLSLEKASVNPVADDLTLPAKTIDQAVSEIQNYL